MTDLPRRRPLASSGQDTENPTWITSICYYKVTGKESDKEYKTSSSFFLYCGFTGPAGVLSAFNSSP